MNLGLDLNMRMGMEQKLSPQMIQSLKLLQMTSLELEITVKQELETNPLLETEEEEESEESVEGKKSESGDDPEIKSEGQEPESSEPEAFSTETMLPGQSDTLPEAPAPEAQETGNEVDWETYLEDGFDPGDKRREEMESPDERFEKVPVYAKSLQDHLLDQLHDREVPKGLTELVEYLIYSLDERGYLVAEGKIDPEAGLKVEPGDVDPEHREIQSILEGRNSVEGADTRIREALHILQSLDPPGIGARNLRECLILQIHRGAPAGVLARRLLEEDFELFERLKIAALARKYEVQPEEIQAAIREIGCLEPHPGRLLAATSATSVIPDLLVEDVEGELVLLLNDRTIPSLRISRAYADLLRKGSRATTDEKNFVRAKLNSATWLIRAIEQRKSTMLKVMHAIMESQPDFFLEGPTHLRPLILQDVADKISMHISTVSRVTNGKYVQTPHGIFELKYFFTAGVSQSDGSEVSSVAAKDEIRQLIQNEDAHHPLSDQKIVELLKSKGLDVARRTVAKYRDQLEVLPARLRKQY